MDVMPLFTPLSLSVVIVQSLSHVQLFATLLTAAHCSFPILHLFPELVQTHVHGVSDAI